MVRIVQALMVAVALAGAAGCGGGCCDGDPGEGAPVGQAPAFLLEDHNDTSPRYGQLVSPRAFLGGVSAWYFGQAL